MMGDRSPGLSLVVSEHDSAFGLPIQALKIAPLVSLKTRDDSSLVLSLPLETKHGQI